MQAITRIPVDTVISSTDDKGVSFAFNWLAEEGDYEYCTLTCFVPKDHTITRRMEAVLSTEEIGGELLVTKLVIPLINTSNGNEVIVTKLISRELIEEETSEDDEECECIKAIEEFINNSLSVQSRVISIEQLRRLLS
jgi:hypothetical protein